MSYVTVSAKIKKELHRKLKKYRIPISEIIRKALEEEVHRREEEEFKETLQRIQRILRKIPSEELVQTIRSSREER